MGWVHDRGALALGIVIFLNKNKKFIGHPGHMVMPGGGEVRYAEVFKVDKRTWDHKGLAYVHYKREGREGRVVVDDLKFGGADRVLARLLGSFSGELIEKAPDQEEADSGSTSPPAAPTPTGIRYFNAGFDGKINAQKNRIFPVAKSSRAINAPPTTATHTQSSWQKATLLKKCGISSSNNLA